MLVVLFVLGWFVCFVVYLSWPYKVESASVAMYSCWKYSMLGKLVGQCL